MKRSRKIGLIILVVLILIQFIRPSKNISAPVITENDISKTYAVTEDVHQIFIKKCYDCHSNNTVYPWYLNIQPVGWWMAYHVREGKEELNFSEFKTYSSKRAAHKLDEISDAVTEGWMPLTSYLWMHANARIQPDEAVAINAWIKTLPVELKKSEHHEHE
jgi:hypothetical protein